MADIIEQELQGKLNEAKRVMIEKAKNKIKFITYRENRDGGIQGLLMSFYMDDNGHIANEFYRVDNDGNLVEVKEGLKKLMDPGECEKAIKKYFLNY